MPIPAPAITQVSEHSREVEGLPPVVVGDDGLLRSRTGDRPMVEELLSSRANVKRELLAAIETMVTRAYPDQPDPLIRFGQTQATMQDSWLSTTLTKAQLDNPDPYGTRRAPLRMTVLSTTLSEQRFDQPDPNHFRRSAQF